METPEEETFEAKASGVSFSIFLHDLRLLAPYYLR